MTSSSAPSVQRKSRARRQRARWLAACVGAFATAVAVAACGTTSTTSAKSFTGSKKGVAEAISSFQSDATSLDGGEICKELLAASVIKRLTEKGAKCEKAIKSALEEVDTFTVTVDSIEVKGSSATAKVKSTVYGKEQSGTMSLTKEGGSWKVSDLD